MTEIRFIDLFAGLGGFHLALHNLGAKCVFASEIDKFARKTYEANFINISPEIFKKDLFNNDIRCLDPQNIPNFDLLCAGFPCQPFSIAGKQLGFADNNQDRGNMFFEIIKIIKIKKPSAIFLENVKNLEKHDNGNTFKIIKQLLQDEGYSIYHKIIKASDYGLPQRRERLFIVGFLNDYKKNFIFPSSINLKYNMSDIFKGKCSREIGFTIRVGGRGSKINDKRNWEFYEVDGQIKRLAIDEAKMMMGLPKNFVFPVSNRQAMKQIGNSVAINAVQTVANNIISYLTNNSVVEKEGDLFNYSNSEVYK